MVNRQLTMLAVHQHLDVALQSFCQAVADQVRTLTGYDRVMIYRFDAHENGEVFAEACSEALEPFLGLCYPAADIPPQARRLYLRNRVRVLGDIYAPAVPLVPRLSPVTQGDPDLSGCLLRSFSPIHLEYFHNMGVRATLTVSIIVQGQLWGLIACHHGAPHWPSHAMRVACDLLSEVISMQITLRSQHLATHAVAQAQAVQHDLIRRLAGHDDWFVPLAEPATDLHTLLNADGVAICCGEKVATIGTTPDRMTIHTLVAWLQERIPEKILITDALSRLNPAFAPFASVASGMIALEIARTEGSYILWFRREVVQTIIWGGNPAEKLRVNDGEARLHPRTSFAAWLTEMHGIVCVHKNQCVLFRSIAFYFVR